MARARSALACLLGMTAEDVRAAKKAGIEVDEIFHFWRKRTLSEMKKSFGFTDSMMNYLKRALVEIPGGVVQLKQEIVEIKEVQEADGEKEQEKARSDASEKRTGASSEKRRGSQDRQRGRN